MINKEQEDKKNIEINKDTEALVIARLETLPEDVKISIGSDGEFSRDELINHVKKNDDIGKKMVEVEMEFLQALKRNFTEDYE